MALQILQIGDERLTQTSKEVSNFSSPELQKLIDDMVDTCEENIEIAAGLAAPQVGKNVQLTVVRRTDLEESMGIGQEEDIGDKQEGSTGGRQKKSDIGGQKEIDPVEGEQDRDSVRRGRKEINEKNDDVVEQKTKDAFENNSEKEFDLWLPMLNPRVVSEDSEYDSLFWEACLSVGKGDMQLWGPVYRPEKVSVEYEDRKGKTHRIEGDGFFSHLLQHEIDHLHGILFLAYVQNPEDNLWKASDFNKYIVENDQYPEVV